MTYVPGPSHALSTPYARVLEGDTVIAPCPLLTGKVSEIQKGLVACPTSPSGNQGSTAQGPNTRELALSVSSSPSQSQGAHLVLLCVPTDTGTATGQSTVGSKLYVELALILFPRLF